MANIPTIEELKAQAISDIESKLGKSAPLLLVSVWQTLATAMAGLAWGIYKKIQWVRRQLFVDTCDWDALLQRGLEYGLAPIDASLWIGTLTATGTNGTNIPSGQILTRAGVTYVSTALATISGGSASVPVEATSAGVAGNLQIADKLEFVTPIIGLDREAVVATIVQEGADAEADEDNPEPFRRRVQFYQQNPPQGGSITDYIIWTTQVAGIAEAFIFSPTPGVINVYPLTSSTDVYDRIPTVPKIAEVQVYLDNLNLKPLNDNPVVLAMTNLGIVVNIQNLVPNTPEMKSIITDEITSFLLSRRPRQFPDESDPINLVNTSQLITIATLSGARFLKLDLKFEDTTPFDTYTLDDNKISFLSAINFT